MPQSTAHNFGLPFPASPDPDQRAEWRRWEEHVAKGRIGAPAIPPEQEQDFLARMADLERVVLGEVRSVKLVWEYSLAKAQRRRVSAPGLFVSLRRARDGLRVN